MISKKKNKKEFVYTERHSKIRYRRVIKKTENNLIWIQHFKKDANNNKINDQLIECEGCEINFKKVKLDNYNCLFKTTASQVRTIDIKKKLID